MKKAFSILGILVGITIIVLGITIASGNLIEDFDVSYTSYARFGADYYTEQYAATQNAANNIKELGEYIESLVKVAGYIVIASGCVVVCSFSCKFGETFSSSIPLNNNSISTNNNKSDDDELPTL